LRENEEDFEEEWEERPKLSKEEIKKRASEKWEQSKKDWTELTEEVYENTIEGKWVQKGPYLYKKDAKLEFATYIGNDYMLTGVDENGKPVLKKKY
jgi:hypothetical protein